MDNQTFRAAVGFLLAWAIAAIAMATAGFIGVHFQWWNDPSRFYGWSAGAWIGVAIGAYIIRAAG